MKRLLCTVALLLPLVTLACGNDAVKFSHGYVRAMAPGQDVTAVYMDIKNTGDHPMTIVSVSSPDAPDVQIHTSIEKDGKMKMEHLDKLVLAPNSKTELKPGGKHIMLMGLKKPLTPESEPITLVFKYEDGSEMTIHSIKVKDMRSKKAN
ncbi:MAG: copper chaperone PCu(A)C [Gammaproteobacteria bacterium]